MSRKVSFSLGIAVVMMLVFAGLTFAQAPTATTATDTVTNTVTPSTTSKPWGPNARNLMRGAMQAGRNFVDGDADGTCDNFVDEDGDGVCDNCQGAGGAHSGMHNGMHSGMHSGMGGGMNGQGQNNQGMGGRGMNRGWNR